MRLAPILLQALPGETIFCVAERAIAKCNETNSPHLIRHNDTDVVVYPGSHKMDIAQKWALQRELYQLKKEQQGE